MDSDRTCRLCLSDPSALNETELEGTDLRRKIDKMFYFQILRSPNCPIWVCGECTNTVDAFYEYAESVYANQKLIRSKLPTEAEFLKIDVKEEDDENETEVEVKPNDVLTSNLEVDVLEELKEESVVEEKPSGTIEDTAIPNQNDIIENRECKLENDCKQKVPQKRKKREVAEQKPKEYRQSELEKEMLKHFSLSCDLCSQPLSSLKELKRHFKVVHKEESYIICCGKKIVRNFMILQHFQLHVDPHAFRCYVCHKDYSTIKVLKTHISEVHSTQETRTIECQVCHKAFVTRRHLNTHLANAHGSIPCPHCPKRLASQLSLNTHVLAVHGAGEKFVCDVCAREFRTKRCLIKHVKIHLGTRVEERVQCSKCAGWFMDQNCLTKHIKRVHEVSEEPMECAICGWQARNKVALYNHHRMSHTECRHQCEHCSKRFRRVQHMREHIAIHHTGLDLYKCSYCNEGFNAKNKLYTHRKTVHPVEYEEELRKWQTKDTTSA